jgi:hypothetical protein
MSDKPLIQFITEHAAFLREEQRKLPIRHQAEWYRREIECQATLRVAYGVLTCHKNKNHKGPHQDRYNLPIKNEFNDSLGWEHFKVTWENNGKQ